jgi:ribulose 1,5-bisphosphate synthetase/thiazole synthase
MRDIRMNRTVTVPASKIAVLDEVDVVVCGGGPSGFVAAIAAARQGARTLLIEQYGFLGGMATAALVGPIVKFNWQGRRIVGGIPWEFVETLAKHDGAIIDWPSGAVPFDVEVYKRIAAKMVENAGVSLLLHTRVTDCLLNRPGKVDYVVVENASGRHAVKTKYVIDCTGIGAVVVKAGLPWRLRKKAQNQLQPMSLLFRLGGVDTDHLENTQMKEEGVKYFNRRLRTAFENSELGRKMLFGGPWLIHGSTIRRGEVTVNMTRYPGSGADVKDLTAAELRLREDIARIVPLLRQLLPELKQSYLIDTATQVGIRETRSITALYNMTVDDILQPKPFPDTVAKGAHPIDVHQYADSGQEVRFITKDYNIPYRALAPRGSQNVLVGGGSVGATAEAFASIRVQAQCMALGEAAGTAVALCLEQGGCAVHEPAGAAVRQRLHKQGAIVDL